MPALDRNDKLACNNCGTLVSKKNLTRHKKRCSAGTVFCSQCANYSTKSQNDLNYHIAKKQGPPKSAIAHVCMVCKEKFTGFYALRQHKSQVHGHTLKTSTDSSPLPNDVDDDNLKEELRASKFYKLTNLTVFAALLKDIPMGCRDVALPDPLLKNHTVNCLTFEQNTRQPYNDNLCLFRALALHLHGNEKLEGKTCRLFNCYLEKKGGIEPTKFQEVCAGDIPLVEDLIQVNIFLYDIDFVDGSIVSELARRSVQK